MLKYLAKAGLTFAAALIFTGAFWVLQWISWWVVFMVAMFIFAPLAHYCVKLWTEEDCYDLEDFFEVLSEKPWKNPPEEEEPHKNKNCIK